MKECGGFSICLKSKKDAIIAAELVKDYIGSKTTTTNNWAKELQVSDRTISVDTDCPICWEDYNQLIAGIASLLNDAMCKEVVFGHFTYFCETGGNRCKHKLITVDGKLTIGEDMSMQDVYNNLSCMYDDPDQIRDILLGMGFKSKDIASECGLCSPKDRQKGYRALLCGASSTALKKINSYYLDELNDLDDDFEEELEDMTPRKACMAILDHYWKENYNDYEEFMWFLEEVYETCLDELDVELISPDEFEDED